MDAYDRIADKSQLRTYRNGGSMRHDIKRDIRQALGLDRDDDSMDDEIDNMTVERQFELFCDWHGLISWGDSLMAALDNLRQAKENR